MKSILMAFFISTIIIYQLIPVFILFAQEVPAIIFTEIMYDLDGPDADREWVEIYNRGGGAVEIIDGAGSNSWRFNDGANHTLNLYQGDLILEPQEVAILASDAETFLLEHSGFSGTIIDTVMSLNNSSETISLSNDGGQTFFTESSYESSWGAGGNGYSLEKIDPAGGDEQSNWQQSTVLGGTPGVVNQIIIPPPPPPPTNNPPVADAGEDQTVLIGEVVTFDGSGSYDPDNDPLTYNWDFGDQTSSQGVVVTHSYSATGTIIVTLEVSDGEFQDSDTLQVTVNEEGSPPPPPNNSQPIAEAGNDQTVYVNDLVYFDGSNSYDPDNDELTYHWDFGNGESAEGITASYQYTQAESYTVTFTVSDGELEDQDTLIVEVLDSIPNSGPSSGSSGSQPSAGGDSDKIIINEILPNPVGPDSEGEFIELFNQGYEMVDLVGWQLQDNSSRVYTVEEGSFSSTEIQPGGYFVITKDISGISLNNSGGDKVILYQPNGNILETVEYSSSALEGKAYARKSNNEWAWTTEITPGGENLFTLNQPPEAKFEIPGGQFFIDEQIEFDAWLSSDPDGDQLTYHWDFGDDSFGDEPKETHSYDTTGTFNIILTVTDSEGLTDASTKQVVVETAEAITASTPSPLITGGDKSIIINEFLVNPVGSDEGEWIELFNNSEEPIDLAGIKIDDAEGGSQPFQLAGYVLEPLGYLVINRSDSKVALNNSSDSVRLLTLDNQIIQAVAYQSTQEGKSYSYNQILNDWFWTEELTPGVENVLPFFGNINITGFANSQDNYYQLSEIKELEKGAKVFTQGMVTVAPGVLGKRVFYIAEIDLVNKEVFLSSGMEIYSSKAEFPQMAVGDVIDFSGKVSEAKGRKRINLQNDSQINVIDSWQLPQPDLTSTGEMSEDLLGSLIQVTGTLLEKKGNNYYLDDGSGELKISLKETANIPKPDVDVGYIVSATGILDLTDSGYRLLPRFPEDLHVGQVLGEQEVELSDEVTSMDSEDQEKKVMKYLLFGGGGALIILISLIIRFKVLSK